MYVCIYSYRYIYIYMHYQILSTGPAASMSLLLSAQTAGESLHSKDKSYNPKK